MYQIEVGKIKLPRFEIANHFDLGHSRVYRGCHRLFPGLKPFQTVSSMEGRREGRKEGRASPEFSNSFRVRGEGRKVGGSRKILRNFLSRYKILSP